VFIDCVFGSKRQTSSSNRKRQTGEAFMQVYWSRFRKLAVAAPTVALLTVVTLVLGCDSGKKDGDVDGGKQVKIEIPESFEGDFNPGDLAVGTKVGKLAPEIEGKDLEGRKFKLSDYRGKVVMLDFWASW